MKLKFKKKHSYAVYLKSQWRMLNIRHVYIVLKETSYLKILCYLRSFWHLALLIKIRGRL